MKKTIQIALICAAPLMSSVYSAETPRPSTPEWIEITTCMTLGNRVAFNTRTGETRDLPQRPVNQQQRNTLTPASNNPLANLVNMDALPNLTSTKPLLAKSNAKPEMTLFGLHEMRTEWCEDHLRDVYQVASLLRDIRQSSPTASVFKFLTLELDNFVGQQKILEALGIKYLDNNSETTTSVLMGTATEYLQAAMTFEGLYVRHEEFRNNTYFVRMMAEMFRRFLESEQPHAQLDAIQKRWMQYDGFVTHLYPQG